MHRNRFVTAAVVAMKKENAMNIRNVMTGIVATLLMASPALADDRDRALLAISQAQATIQLASSAGAETWAPDIQVQAGTALERARRHLAKSKERRSFYAAREADAYARLALAKAQTRTAVVPSSY